MELSRGAVDVRAKLSTVDLPPRVSLQEGIQRGLDIAGVLIEADGFGRYFAEFGSGDFAGQFLAEFPWVNRVVMVGQDECRHADLAPERAVGARRVIDDRFEFARGFFRARAVELV